MKSRDSVASYNKLPTAGLVKGGNSSEVTTEAPATLRSLYPAIQSHQKGFLKVSHLHTIYYEVFGNPKGKPALFLHGGPGAGCSANHARFFDPEVYRIILFDQRGCGASKPKGCVEENTTWNLVADIEKLRAELGVATWLVLGGSWGVTLGLAYAQAHPEAVGGLILRGVCLLRRQEIDWFYRQGANALYPFAWENLLSAVHPWERSDLVSAFYKRLTSADPSQQQQAARAWLRWEMGLSTFSTAPYLYTWDGAKYASLPAPQASLSPPPPVSPQPKTEAAQTDAPSSPAPPPPSSSSHRNGAANGAAGSEKEGGTGGDGERDLRGGEGMSSTVAQARLECHYFYNGGFLREGQLVEEVGRIRHIPAVIVQGRFDFVCPLQVLILREGGLQNAFDLHRAWPEAVLRVVPNAGHSMYEPGIRHELLLATDKWRDIEY